MKEDAPGVEETRSEPLPPPALRLVLLPYVGIGLSIALTAHLLPSSIQEYAYSVLLAAMVYLPVFFIDRRKEPLAEWGLHTRRLPKDIGWGLLAALVIFPPFVLGAHGWFSIVFGKSFAFAWTSENFAALLATQLFVVALPEEIFYRGWMQPVFDRRFKPWFKLLGAPIGWGLVLTSLLFAVGHLALTPHPFRLAVFFPSLVFGWLRIRTGGVAAPIVFHGLANVLNQWIFECYSGS